MKEFLLKVLKDQGIEGDQAEKIVSNTLKQAEEDGKTIIFDEKKNPSYIPKARLDAEIEKRKGVQGQLDEANSTIKGLEKTVADNEEAVKSLEDYKKKAVELEEELKSTEKAHKVKEFISGFERQPHDIEDLMKYIDNDAIKVSEEGVVGLKEQLENLVAGKDYLFKPVEGGTGNPGSKGKGNSKENGQEKSIGAQLAKQRNSGSSDVADQRAEFFK